MKQYKLSKTRQYSIFKNMKQRCYNQNDSKYKYYGGKGITICDEWLNDFKAFYDWSLANGYADDLTIDRIDSSKGYSPENCQWISMDENRAKAHGTARKEQITMSGKFNQAEYDKANTTRYQLKLNNITDADIIAKLNTVKSKQGYIKECIRKDLKNSQRN